MYIFAKNHIITLTIMKRTTLIASLLVLISFSLISCEADSIDPVYYINNNNNPGPVNNNPPGGDDDDDDDPVASEGDYWPMAVNNEWDYVYTGDFEEDPAPMKIIGTEVIGGVTYYKINHYFQESGTDELTGEADIHLRKDGGTYYERVSVDIPAADGLPSITVAPYELIVFKDNLEVGESWTQTVVQTTTYGMSGFPPVTLTLTYKGTIMQKDLTVTVEGETYTDVIKEKFVQTVMGTDYTVYVWFAKNVGPIKSESIDEGLSYQTALTSYIIN